MGLFAVEITLSKTVQRSTPITDQFWVDSGVPLSALPKALWQALGLKAVDRVRIRLEDERAEMRLVPPNGVRTVPHPSHPR